MRQLRRLPLARVMVLCQGDGPGAGNLFLSPTLRAFPILATARDKPLRVGVVMLLPPGTRS